MTTTASQAGGVRAWTIDLTAASSIVHVGDTRGLISLLRRETIVDPTGSVADVPLISGNAFRGRLRRITATLFTEALDVDGTLALRPHTPCGTADPSPKPTLNR